MVKKQFVGALIFISSQAFCAELNADGYIRGMYLGDRDTTASAVGGMVGISPSNGALTSKVAFYTVSPLGVKEDAAAKLFSYDKGGYSLLGEASLGYKNDKLALNIGRQKVVTPLVDMDDGRIVPNLFEGVSAKYKISGSTTVEGYYLTRMSGFWSQIFSGRDMKDFVSMSEAAGYASVSANSPLLVLGVKHAVGEHSLGAWAYHSVDLLDIYFGEYQRSYAVDKNTKLGFAVQGSVQRANGKLNSDLNTRGKTLDQEYGGVKISASHKDVNGYVAATVVSDSDGKMDKNMMNVWAGIPQYTVVNEHVMKSFDTDGAKMYKAQLGYSFTGNTDATASYLYVDGLSKKGVKDVGVAEFVLSTKSGGFSLNGVLLLNDTDSRHNTIFKSALQYSF